MLERCVGPAVLVDEHALRRRRACGRHGAAARRLVERYTQLPQLRRAVRLDRVLGGKPGPPPEEMRAQVGDIDDVPIGRPIVDGGERCRRAEEVVLHDSREPTRGHPRRAEAQLRLDAPTVCAGPAPGDTTIHITSVYYLHTHTHT